MEILILAAHPDDEVLGMGATIKKLSKNNNVFLAILTDGASAQYNDKKMISVRKKACQKSSKHLGIKKIFFIDYPDMKLDTIPHVEINKKIELIMKEIKPEIVYSPSPNDLNKDHKIVFESAIVTTRPHSSNVKQFFCYEIPGLQREQFCPNVYTDISKEFKSKVKALNFYKTEMEDFPHPRSVKTLESQAHLRGMESGLKMAEAFQLIKMITK